MTKEQQIDKMARMLCYQQDVGNCTECYRYNSCLYRLTAKEIYNAGFRKQSKGEWQMEIDEYRICATEFTCSHCGVTFSTSECTDERFLETMKFCPNCGARMRGAEH